MSRPTRFETHQFLGDKRSMVVHDLDNTKAGCELDDLLKSERFLTFGPDSLPEAKNRCFDACRYCLVAE